MLSGRERLDTTPDPAGGRLLELASELSLVVVLLTRMVQLVCQSTRLRGGPRRERACWFGEVAGSAMAMARSNEEMKRRRHGQNCHVTCTKKVEEKEIDFKTRK